MSDTTSQVTALGYVGCHVRDLSAWHELLTEIFGLERRADSDAENPRYRIDQQHHRLTLMKSEQDKLAYIGWAVDTQADLEAVARRVEGQGIAVERGDSDLRSSRQVMDLIVFTGPDNVRTEIFFGPTQDFIPYTPQRGIEGYKTGALGMGHIVLASADPEATSAWYRDVLGFKLSDYIFWDEIEATFLHCNPRHHSLALMNAGGPMQPGDLGHFMFESTSLNDVGRAYDLVKERQVPLALTLGRHTNDHMTSFYVYSPSGWWIEYGYGGREIDDAVWEPKFYNSPKLWGHEMLPPPDGAS